MYPRIENQRIEASLPSISKDCEPAALSSAVRLISLSDVGLERRPVHWIGPYHLTSSFTDSSFVCRVTLLEPEALCASL